MRFLANENFPNPSVKILREHGYDVNYILESNRSVSDEKVIEIALTEKRIILTFDKDYGEIIFRHKIVSPPAVIFFRYKGESPVSAGENLLKLVNENRFELENLFTVVSKDNVRQRKY